MQDGERPAAAVDGLGDAAQRDHSVVEPRALRTIGLERAPHRDRPRAARPRGFGWMPSAWLSDAIAGHALEQEREQRHARGAGPRRHRLAEAAPCTRGRCSAALPCRPGRPRAPLPWPASMIASRLRLQVVGRQAAQTVVAAEGHDDDLRRRLRATSRAAAGRRPTCRRRRRRSPPSSLAALRRAALDERRKRLSTRRPSPAVRLSPRKTTRRAARCRRAAAATAAARPARGRCAGARRRPPLGRRRAPPPQASERQDEQGEDRARHHVFIMTDARAARSRWPERPAPSVRRATTTTVALSVVLRASASSHQPLRGLLRRPDAASRPIVSSSTTSCRPSVQSARTGRPAATGTRHATSGSPPSRVPTMLVSTCRIGCARARRRARRRRPASTPARCRRA